MFLKCLEYLDRLKLGVSPGDTSEVFGQWKLRQLAWRWASRAEEEARDILATAAKNQAEDGPSTRRAAIRACKYLRAMVNQHGPLIQSAHEAAKIHTQRSKGNAAAAMQHRPKEGELPVIAPELTSELLHCLSTLPDPWPLAKITIDMEKPSQWVSKMCRLFCWWIRQTHGGSAHNYTGTRYGASTQGCPEHSPQAGGKNYWIPLRVASDLSNASKACIGHQSTPPLFHVP